ncbi:MAG: MFS transporter [Bauldia sp.]|nr:MFS transporter [Bauldia sp.]
MDTTPARTEARPARTLTRARLAVSIVFLVLGFGGGLWAVHIPIVAERLAIAPGVIGLALLTGAVGAVATMLGVGVVLGRVGSRLPTAVLAFVFPVVTPLLIVAPSTVGLFAGIFVFGAAMGGLDVAMNTQAAEVEEARRRPTMSSFHGFYSVGTLAGSSLGGLVIAAGWGEGGGAILLSAVFFAMSAWAAMNLWPTARPVAQGPRLVLPTGLALAIGMCTFLVFAAEGAVTDWSALYLSTVKQSGAALAASGVALFSVTMAVGRLTGDWLVARLGNVPTVLFGGGLVAVGMVISVAAPWPLLSAVGFALVGLGAANVAPVAISAATRVPGLPPGVGVAAVTTMGYAGFLIFPPVLGFIADASGLSASLMVVAVMGLAIAAFAPAVRR